MPADNDDNGRPASARRIEQAANNAFLQLAARFGIVIIMTVALPMGAWLGSRLIETLDMLVVKLDDNMIATDRRFDAVENRVTKIEVEVENDRDRPR